LWYYYYGWSQRKCLCRGDDAPKAHSIQQQKQQQKQQQQQQQQQQ
jgi:hypothetical protein